MAAKIQNFLAVFRVALFATLKCDPEKPTIAAVFDMYFRHLSTGPSAYFKISGSHFPNIRFW